MLTQDVAVQYAMRMYDNPSCIDIQEFTSDYNNYKIVSRFLQKYKKHGTLKERLILNALVLMCNVFKEDAAIRILFCHVDKEHWSALKTFLLFMGRCPKVIRGVPTDINTSDIPVDMKVANSLRILAREG